MDKNNKKYPPYSVLMSVYSKVNSAHLKESIDSIINQTYSPNELIIVKDGPLTIKQNELIDEYEKRYKFIKIIEFKNNCGAGVAYNEAIKQCGNDYAAIMDSDDYADLTKFEKQIRYLIDHPEIDAIGTNAVEFLNNKNSVISTRIMPETNDEIIKFAHGRCPMIQPTVLFKVSSVINVGSYQKSPLTEDYDLYIRMIMNGCNFYTLQEILYYIRTSDDFFKRRGGIKYLKPILSFKYKYYKKGFFSFGEYLKTSIASLVTAIMPNYIRTIIYKKFLRK